MHGFGQGRWFSAFFGWIWIHVVIRCNVNAAHWWETFAGIRLLENQSANISENMTRLINDEWQNKANATAAAKTD